MNALPASVLQPLGWSLIAFLWQGALVGLVCAIVLMLLRNARPQARYAVCCAALALCIALPVAGVWRGWHTGGTVEAAPPGRFVQLAPNPDHHSAIAAPADGWPSNLQFDLSWIVALWSIGAALLATRMAMGMMWVARAGRHQGPAHPRWQRRLDRLAERIGVECRVRLHVVAELATPVAAGCWKPVVLVPAALIARMPLDLVEALLAHELAHIRRHDYLVNLLQSAIEALLFYHPVVWWLSKQIRLEREQIADDLAVQAIGDPQRLALALHELDLFQEALHRADARDGFIGTPSLIPAANGGHLMSRIQRLIRPNQHALSWKIALPILGLAAACLTVYAHDAAPAVAAVQPVAPVVSTRVVSTPAIAVSVNTTAIRAALARTPATAARAAVLAVATASSAAAEATRTVRIADASAAHEDAYAIIHGNRDGISMSGDSRDIPQIEKARKQVHGDFIWTRHAGRTYVVQDPALLAQVEQAWKSNEAIDRQMEALDAQMKIPEAKVEALSRKMEQLTNDHSPASVAMEKYDAQMEPLEHAIEAIGSRMEAVGDKMEEADDKQREVLQRELATLQVKIEPLNAQVKSLSALMEQQGKQIEANAAPIEQLGRQIEDESRPMEQIGKQMEVLGKQEEQIARQADRTIRALVEQAVRTGKALPIENVRQ